MTAGEQTDRLPGTRAASDVAALVYRLELAGSRHRAARAHLLCVDEREIAALEHLAASEGLTPTELGRRLALSSGGVSVLLDRLEAAGHVERLPHPGDRRKRIVRLTPAGGEWLRAYLDPITATLERAAAWLSGEDCAVVVRFIDHLVALREIEADQTPRRAPSRERLPAQPVW
ncbi:MAG: MarR family winged helix-turn-helix transcriptional regulator [Thermoleophilaceae bacterium]